LEKPEADSFFIEQQGVFIGQDAARGPWSVDHCHAGPVTGLIARAVEAVIGGDKMLTRLTVDLLRPQPVAGLRVTAEMVRDGRKVATARAEVTDLEGRICASATSMHIAEGDVGPVATAPVPPPPLVHAEATPGRFPAREVAHDQPMIGHFIDVAYPPDKTREPGPTTIWMKTPPLLPGETPSSFQRLCPLADCGNGISRNEELTDVGFMNADITIVAHRRTMSDWLASRAISHWHDTGLGLARAEILDEQGPVASVLQTVLLSPNRK